MREMCTSNRQIFRSIYSRTSRIPVTLRAGSGWIAAAARGIHALRDADATAKRGVDAMEADAEEKTAEKPSKFSGQPLRAPLITLSQMLESTVKSAPDAEAMVFYGRVWSYAQLAAAVSAAAAACARCGVGKGDRVGLLLPNCPQYVVSYYALARIGAVTVQLNPLLTGHELAEIVADCGMKAAVAIDRLAPLLLQIAGGSLDCVVSVAFGEKRATADVADRGDVAVDVPADVADRGDVRERSWDAWLQEGFALAKTGEPLSPPLDPSVDAAVLQYTGGTTGSPKGALLTHANLVTNVEQIREFFLSAGLVPGDRCLCALPLFHVYGMTCAMNASIAAGMSLVLVPQFQPDEVMEIIRTYRPSYFPGVPTMYMALAARPGAATAGLDAIRVCISGSAPFPPEAMRRFEAATGAIVLEGYGLSEASPLTHVNPFTGHRKPGSVGPPVGGTEAAVVDSETGSRILPVGAQGELVVRGPQVMAGYFGRPQETGAALRDGWLYTGDIARMDEDGYTYIVDRKKDVIIASGFKVYPREVEEVLLAHPAIAEAAVIGVPDAYRGETVAAHIVLRAGATLSRDELDAHCRRSLASYKVPHEVVYAAGLPKTAVGKTLRRALRESHVSSEATP